MTALKEQTREEVVEPGPVRTYRARRPWPIVFLVLVISVSLVNDVTVPWLSPIAGFWLILALPVHMLCMKVKWGTPSVGERVAYSVAAVLALLMSGGLLINTILPPLGVEHPLSRGPVLVVVDVIAIALTLWRPLHWRPLDVRSIAEQLRRSDWWLMGIGALVILMVVMGANRLNNGRGGGMTLAALVAAAALLVLLFACRKRLNPATIPVGVYFVGLAMVLMTSLRGWLITGHDIQREFRVFQLTSVNNDWEMSRFQDAYNACLSITILPTMLQRIIDVSDPYVYKAIVQVLFAICPVMVYQITRRFGGTSVGLLAAVYFMSFPTYFTDMPFLIRQEIAFIFVGAIILMTTNPVLSLRSRRAWIAVFSVGMVLAHYSTTYVMCGILIASWLGQRIAPFAARGLARLRRSRRPRRIPVGAAARPVLGLLSIGILLGCTFFWNSVVTHTSGGLSRTLTRAVESVIGSSDVASSSDVKYSLFSLAQPSEQERINLYSQAADRDIRTGDSDDYYSHSVVDQYPTPAVAAAELPLTAVGRVLESAGISVSWLNGVLRQGTAKLIQLFVLVGLAAALLGSRRLSVSREYYALGWASLIVVFLQVLLPGISVDYGVLRAFQQSLFMFAPFLALGSVVIFARFPADWKRRSAFGFSMVFFLSLTGVIPQVLGGYPPQLHLNNSGRYFDIYYVHPEETAAISWLQRAASNDALRGVQSEVQTDRYTFTRISAYSGINSWNDIYPSMVRKNSYVFLGYGATHRSESTISYEGDLITYEYPLRFLQRVKSKVYASSGAQIYR